MPANSRRWTWLFLFACVLLTVALWATRGWVWLGVAPINEARAPYSDTLASLATAVNCAGGLGEWRGRACFVPSVDAQPRSIAYEPWLSLQRWGLDSEPEALTVAWLCVLAFCVALALTLRPQTFRHLLLGLAVFATSAVQLAIERANFDLLIAALLCLAGALLASTRVLPALAGVLALALATVLKLYTAAACLLAWLVTWAPLRWVLPASLAALALVVMLIGPRELLLLLGGGAVEGATRFSTGAHWLFRSAGVGWGIAALALALLTTVIVGLRLRGSAVPDFDRWPRRTAITQLAVLVVVPLFLLKDSYDYRLVLWLPCLALPFAWLPVGTVATAWRGLGIALIVLFLFVAGIELPCTWLDELAARSGRTWPTTLATALTYAKQFAAWTLAALLSLLAASIVYQRLRPWLTRMTS